MDGLNHRDRSYLCKVDTFYFFHGEMIVDKNNDCIETIVNIVNYINGKKVADRKKVIDGCIGLIFCIFSFIVFLMGVHVWW